MGIYYAIVDHKNKRFLWLGKVYAFVRFFNDKAPFTLTDREILCGKDYGDNPCYYSTDSFQAIVKFCNEADWECEVMADDYAPSYHDLNDDYQRYEIEMWGIAPKVRP